MTELTSTLVEIIPSETLEIEDKNAVRTQAFIKVFGIDYTNRFTDPIHFLNGSFQNYRIHKFYEHNFSFISRNLFAEYVYLRRPKYDRAILTRYSEVMTKKITGAGTVIKRFHDQIATILSQNNADDSDIGYLRPNKELVPIIHAQSRSYYDLLLLADSLFTITAAAVLQGLIDSEQKKNAENKSIIALRAIGATVRAETIVLRKEAHRVRDEMKKEGVLEDQDMDTAIETQSSVIDESIAIEKTNTQIDGVSFPESEETQQYVAEKEGKKAAAAVSA